MDNFMNLAKKGYAAYEQAQHAQQNQGNQQPQNYQQDQQDQSQNNAQQNQGYQQSQNYQQDQRDQQQDNNYQGQSGQGNLSVDHGQAARIANSDSGQSGNSELFSQAMAYVAGGNHSTPVNEQHITDAHNQVYGSGDVSNVSASALGGAAALQTLKSFMSSGGNTGNSGGEFQTKMIGLAMSEAAKQFDASGHPGDKQDAVSGAAATMMKLLVQSKFSGGGDGSGGLSSFIGGSNSSGLSSLLSMASQFTK